MPKSVVQPTAVSPEALFEIPHKHGSDYARWLAECTADRLIGHGEFAENEREDLQQDLLLRLLESWPAFDPRKSQPLTFVAIVTRNAASKLVRQRRMERQHIRFVLLNLYSESAKLYALRAKAGEPARYMDQPCLCLLGTAVPDTFYGSLNDRMLRKGLLARMLVFDSGRRGRNQLPRECSMSSLVGDAVEYWKRLDDDIPSELRGRNLADMRAYPKTVDLTPDAEQLIRDLRESADDEYDKAEAQHDRAAMALWARCAEKAEKLALIYACSADFQQPLIDRAAVEWASEVLMHQTRRMLFLTDQHFAENQTHADLNRVAAIIRDHGQLSRSQFTRKTQFLKRRDRDDMLRELIERHDVEVQQVATTGCRSEAMIYWIGV